MADLLLEQLEDLYGERADLERRLAEATNAAEIPALQERLSRVNRALGEHVGGGDELVEFWDAEIKAGRVPDLDMTVADLQALRRGSP